MRDTIFYSFLICFFAQPALAQNSLNSRQSLVMATYQYADNPRIKNLEPLAAYIREIHGVKTTVKSFPTIRELLQAMEREEVDIAFLNTFGYLLLREKTSAFEIGGVMNIPRDQEKSYKSVLAVGKNIPVNKLDDVIQNASDFVLFLVSPESTSGNLVPRLHLASLQPGYPERFFLELQYAGDHALTMEHALKGEFALCAFGSNEYDKLGADTVRLKKLWVSPAIPPGPVVFRKALSGSLREELQKTLLELNKNNPAAFESIKAGWTEFIPADKYRVAEDSYYDSLLQLSVNREVAMKIIRDFVK